MGTILTYASYISKQDNLLHTSLKVISADTLIAILAGIAILPAVFSFDINPEAGPGLAFLTLPKVFQNLPAGEIWAILFFILLTFAALTSSISLLEVSVSYLVEEKNIKRTYATIIATCLITFLGSFCTLSFGPLKEIQIFGLNLFEVCDYFSSNILLPMGGFLLCIIIPLLDFVFIYLGFLGIKNLWATFKADNINYYPSEYTYVVIPIIYLSGCCVCSYMEAIANP